jgi:hypothetical protein
VGSVVGLWLVLASAAEGGIRMALTMAFGAALGLLLVQATRALPQHPKGPANLEYIERIWEPTAAGDGRSFALFRELPAPRARESPPRGSRRTPPVP